MVVKYGVIYIDPPWAYSNWKGKENGAAKAHYNCLSTKEIADIPIGDFAADNCAMLMWVTGPKLAEGAHNILFDAWGFRPVTTAFVWVKTTSDGKPYCGLGFYTRSGAEFCLLGIKGRVSRNKDATKVMQVITEPRIYRHSEKPGVMYSQIEELFPGPYIEIFARNRRLGWDSWGNQLPEE